MSLLIPIEDFDNFRLMRDVKADSITAQLRDVMRSLDEREEMEPFLRLILADDAQTPHGPAELVDIFTHKLTHKSCHGMAAFILKGKSFKTVRPSDVSHQIYRLEKIEGLRFAIFATPGTVLDQAKEQFISTCERLKISYGFFDATDIARLFIAAGFFCPKDGSRISAGRCKCGYSPEHRFLNILQQDALKSLRDSHKIGQRSGLVVLPPGSGKTRIAADDSKHYGARRILYVAHTHEILDVAQSEFEAVFGSKEVARLEPPLKLNQFSQVSLTTIQLLARHATKLPRETFDYIVVDEFHHAAAKSYRTLIGHFAPKYLLGLTATPFRGDRQDIWKLCGENTVVSHELRGAIEMGVLVPYHYYGCFDNVDYSAIRSNGTSYSIRDLEHALTIPARDHAVIKKWRELAEGRPSVAFCCSIEHANRVAANFSAAGIPSAAYTCAISREKRSDILEQFKNGELKVLSVVDVFNEGADLPFLECLLFLRPTDSKRIFFQQLGRGLRRSHGKAMCLVIDFIGNFRNAYRIVEYQGLAPVEEDDAFMAQRSPRTAKEILNLPLGCEVYFDDKVIDLFASQALNPANATRHNIGRILIYQYRRLQKTLGRQPRKVDVDRHSRLHSGFYAEVFGSWKKFEQMMASL
jgi:superfamily II DNA or RNA helicase